MDGSKIQLKIDATNVSTIARLVHLQTLLALRAIQISFSPFSINKTAINNVL
jgi:hypothetical protein